MAHKTDEELDQILNNQDDYTVEAIEAAQEEVENRKANGHKRTVPKPSPKPFKPENPYIERFDTKKMEKRLTYMQSVSVLLILIGMALFITKDYSTINRFVDIFKLLDIIIFPLFGALYYISHRKKLKRIEGSFVEFREHGFSLKSNGRLLDIDSIDEIQEINIKLTSIEITPVNQETITVNLNDYMSFENTKAIKTRFQFIQTELEKMKRQAS